MFRTRKKYYLIISFCFFLIFIETKAQDPSFSVFYHNPVYYNPAYTGFHSGINTFGTYRRLWPKLPAKFETSLLSWDANMNEIKGLSGMGLLITSDIEGEGFLTTQSISYLISSMILSRPGLYLAAGFSPSINFKSVNTRNLIFSDQLDEYYGPVKPSDFLYRGIYKATYADMGAGVIAQYETNPRHGPFNKNMIICAGASVQHAFQPDISFYNTSSRLPRKFLFHANVDYPVIHGYSRIFVSPGVFYESQGSMNTVVLGSDFSWDRFALDLWYRRAARHDAAIFGFSIDLIDNEINILTLCYTYDLTISGLRSATGGSHEISIHYNLNKSLLKSWGIIKHKRNLNCPRSKWIHYKDITKYSSSG